ncbi:MAG TPA: phnA protein [Spirochaetota bacterium]|nr:phnA protein [Spirochaetota bacterium]HQP50232.1 phnA protein [Spirochaetota bacterium]
MVKGYDAHQQRQDTLASFGRELARRSGSKCELCKAAGVKLTVFEVPPAPADPEAAKCLFLCDICREQIGNPKKFDAAHWRCLNEAVWSDVSAVKVMSVRMLRRLAPGESWAGDILEEVYLDEDEEAWAAEKC